MRWPPISTHRSKTSPTTRFAVTYLLDTHPFLWLVSGDRRLSTAVFKAYEDPANRFLLSLASIWEMAIKISLGKLALTVDLNDLLVQARAKQGINFLAIEVPHVLQVSTMPFHHRDPFDRLLAAQARTEKLPIVSIDDSFDAYGVTRYW